MTVLFSNPIAIEAILSHLDSVKDLVAASGVNKAWNKAANNEQVVRSVFEAEATVLIQAERDVYSSKLSMRNEADAARTIVDKVFAMASRFTTPLLTFVRRVLFMFGGVKILLLALFLPYVLRSMYDNFLLLGEDMSEAYAIEMSQFTASVKNALPTSLQFLSQFKLLVKACWWVDDAWFYLSHRRVDTFWCGHMPGSVLLIGAIGQGHRNAVKEVEADTDQRYWLRVWPHIGSAFSAKLSKLMRGSLCMKRLIVGKKKQPPSTTIKMTKFGSPPSNVVVPDILQCPIGHSLFYDAAVLRGELFEREALRSYINQHGAHPTNPSATNVKVSEVRKCPAVTRLAHMFAKKYHIEIVNL